MSAWPPSLVNQSVHPAKCRANCFWDRKISDGSSKGIVRGGEGEYAFFLPHWYFILGSDVKHCVWTVTDPDQLEVVSRWSGCFMPKLKCHSASGLVTGRASLFVEVKKAFFKTKLVTRYPALNSLKAVALPESEGWFHQLTFQKLLTAATAFVID